MDYLQYMKKRIFDYNELQSFKPYYKWITFNTENLQNWPKYIILVLNLIINGLPSILNS